jgi:hypothetical protein
MRKSRRKDAAKRIRSSAPQKRPVGRPKAEKTILRQRRRFYGPSISAESAIGAASGRMIRGVLESWFQAELPGDIPPHIVHLIFVGLKLARAATPHKRNDDNYLDGHNYLTLAEKHHAYLDDRGKQRIRTERGKRSKGKA